MTNNYEKKTVSFNLCLQDSNEFVSSFYWNDEYYISGIDILKIIKFKLRLLNYKIIKMKKYEGYISSHDYERADDAKLAELAKKIKG